MAIQRGLGQFRRWFFLPAHLRAGLEASRQLADRADPPSHQFVAFDFPHDSLTDFERQFLAHVFRYGDLPFGRNRRYRIAHVVTAYCMNTFLRKLNLLAIPFCERLQISECLSANFPRSNPQPAGRKVRPTTSTSQRRLPRGTLPPMHLAPAAAAPECKRVYWFLPPFRGRPVFKCHG